MEEQGKPRWLIFLKAKDDLGCGPRPKQGMSQHFFRSDHVIEHALVFRKFTDELQNQGNICYFGGTKVWHEKD
jgi:hypothetical protein